MSNQEDFLINHSGSGATSTDAAAGTRTSAREMSRLSHQLSKILRHQAVREKIVIRSDGYVLVQDLLNHRQFNGFSLANIHTVVANCAKQRFQLDTIDGCLMIRATQGHTIKSVDDELLLTEITDPAELPVCVHGTYEESLPIIMATGLNKMKRNHIHMATGLPTDAHVKSGMRYSAEVLIFINVAAAMEAGVKFLRSRNDVILSRGLGDTGAIPAQYFEKVVHFQSNIASGAGGSKATAQTITKDRHGLLSVPAPPSTSAHNVNTATTVCPLSQAPIQCLRDMTGIWRRIRIFEPIGTLGPQWEQDSVVLWFMSASGVYIDLRIPPPLLPAKTTTAVVAAAATAARSSTINENRQNSCGGNTRARVVKSFAGTATYDSESLKLTWKRQLDYRILPAADVGIMSFVSRNDCDISLYDNSTKALDLVSLPPSKPALQAPPSVRFHSPPALPLLQEDSGLPEDDYREIWENTFSVGASSSSSAPQTQARKDSSLEEIKAGNSDVLLHKRKGKNRLTKDNQKLTSPHASAGTGAKEGTSSFAIHSGENSIAGESKSRYCTCVLTAAVNGGVSSSSSSSSSRVGSVEEESRNILVGYYIELNGMYALTLDLTRVEMSLHQTKSSSDDTSISNSMSSTPTDGTSGGGYVDHYSYSCVSISSLGREKRLMPATEENIKSFFTSPVHSAPDGRGASTTTTASTSSVAAKERIEATLSRYVTLMGDTKTWTVIFAIDERSEHVSLPDLLIDIALSPNDVLQHSPPGVELSSSPSQSSSSSSLLSSSSSSFVAGPSSRTSSSNINTSTTSCSATCIGDASVARVSLLSVLHALHWQRVEGAEIPSLFTK